MVEVAGDKYDKYSCLKIMLCIFLFIIVVCIIWGICSVCKNIHSKKMDVIRIKEKGCPFRRL